MENVCFIAWVSFSHRTEKFDFEIHWNTLIFFVKKYMMLDLNIVDFISVFGFTLFKKLRNTNFERHWNALIFFDKKDMMSDLNISRENIYDFTSFPLLGFTLVISWRFSNLKVTVKLYCLIWFTCRFLVEIWQQVDKQILDFIEIVLMKLKNLFSNQNLSQCLLSYCVFQYCYDNSFKLKKFLMF